MTIKTIPAFSTVLALTMFGLFSFDSSLLAFKLEKDVISLTQTEAKKAPEKEEENKLPEVPATPTFKTESFDNFMTSSPIQKKPPAAKKAQKKSSKRKVKKF